jgi:hypothetical protein
LILDQLRIGATEKQEQKRSCSRQNLISAEVESFAAKAYQLVDQI